MNDPDRIIQVSAGMEAGTFFASQCRNGYEINRTYTIKSDAAAISTTVKRIRDVPEEEFFDPIFALHGQDLNGLCDFYGTDLNLIGKTFDYKRDDSIAFDEIMFYEFQKQPYAQQPIKKLVLRFVDSAYMITAEKPFRAYLQFTCVFLRFLPASVHADGWTWKNDMADFGAIRIQKL